MNDRAIVFALANPDPEVEANEVPSNVETYASGRSDEDQINNFLAFPGIFRGLVDAGATKVTRQVKLAAITALTDMVSADDRLAGRLLPSPMRLDVAAHVARRVYDAANGTVTRHEDPHPR